MTIWDGAPDLKNIWRPNTLPEYEYWLGEHPFDPFSASTNLLRIPVRMSVPGSDRVYSWEIRILAKSYDQGADKWQSAGVALIRFDEEPPYDIWSEANMRRGRDWELRQVFTLTPVKGITWIYDELYEPMLLGDPKAKHVFFVHGTIFDNKQNLFPGAIEEILTLYPKGHQEHDIRVLGKWKARSGLVYKDFDRDVHVIDDFFPWELDGGTWQYTHYRWIDYGLRNPSAVLWVAVDSLDRAFIYQEMYGPGRTLKMLAEEVNALTDKRSVPVHMTVIDPQMNQTDPESGARMIDTLAENDLVCVPGDRRKIIGIQAVIHRLFHHEIFVCRRCMETIREFVRYRYKEMPLGSRSKVDPKEDVQKVDDHAMDAIRYGVMTGCKWIDPRDLVEEDVEPGCHTTGY